MIRFKDYTVDLGGDYPGKQKAVIDHAAFLGWDKREIVKSQYVCRILYFHPTGVTGWDNEEFFLKHPELHKLYISAEKFLELTHEDIKPEVYHKYRIWAKDGSIVETDEFLKEDEAGNLAGGMGEVQWERGSFVKAVKMSEGVAKIEGQL